MRTRGAALVAVLAALALLSLLAVSFCTVTATDRDISRNYLAAARARLLASSGVETAIDRLRVLGDTGAFWNGSDWKVCGHPAAACREAPCRLRIGAGEVEIRVLDAQGKLNVNDGIAWGPGHAVSANLARILDVLGALDVVRIPRLGQTLLRARPPGGYASIHDLLPALGRDGEAFERVRRFVTVRAWSDPDVAHPVPFSGEMAGDSLLRYDRPVGANGPVYRFGHQRNARGELIQAALRVFDPRDPSPVHNAVWGLDSLNPRWIEIVARSPVNVNAAPRELLVALLTGLEGVFLVERRRGLRVSGPASACGSPGAAYGWTSLRYSYDAEGNEGDEAGLLYRTAPLPAEMIADEIVARRDRRPSPHLSGIDYKDEGPFRGWADFHRFCDGLVSGGLLRDPRVEQFWDWDEAGRRVPASEAQRAVASQAMADVLKANFDPNLHLNEINPDRVLFTHVDKTDLTVHSTEFCFGPMGIFEIEASARIDGARAGVEAVVKTFDALRQTHQKHFSAGASGPRKGDVETNTNAAIESGPEVDNGPAPAENEYEGWLRPATLGSTLLGAERKASGELRSTLSDPRYCPGATTSPRGGPHLGSGMHAHFEWDHVAHHHAGYGDLVRLPQGAWQSATARRCSLAANWPDRGETIPGPYGPADAGRGGKSYRLARSFRGAPPPASEEAPSDLRVDGAYVERDAAFGWWLDENESFNINEGGIAFWIKPAFDPQSTGKRRTLLSAGRYHETAPELMNPSPWALYYVPPTGDDAGVFPAYGSGTLRPGALAFGFGFSPATGYNREFDPALGAAAAHAWAFTPTLGPELFRAHAWTHVAVTWKIPKRRGLPPDAARIYVNGRLLAGSETVRHRFDGDEGQPFENTPWWSLHSKQVDGRWVKNLLRIGGETSTLFPGGLLPGNYCADATIDEVYVWLGASQGLAGAKAIHGRGRFYEPDDADPADGLFTSGPIELDTRLLGLDWTARGGEVDVAARAVDGELRWTAKFKGGALLDDVTLYVEAFRILGWIPTGGRP
jgi:hypothetical protein